MEVKLQQYMRFNDDQVAQEVLHSCQDMRVLLINLKPGQALEPHTSSSSVSLHLVGGQGEALCDGEWVAAETGTIRFYPPGEPHGVRAGAEPVSVLMTLAPRP